MFKNDNNFLGLDIYYYVKTGILVIIPRFTYVRFYWFIVGEIKN